MYKCFCLSVRMHTVYMPCACGDQKSLDALELKWQCVRSHQKGLGN